MPSTLVEKEVDIYQYPEEFEGNSGSITLGDLHGNSVKLAHVLFRHNIIKFKDEISEPAKQYNKFVTTYERMADYVHLYDEQLNKLYSQDEKIQDTEMSIDLYYQLRNKENRNDREDARLATLDITALTESLEQSKKIKAAAFITLERIVAEYKTMIGQFNEFMDTLEVDDQKALVRLIGDEFADRGSNDYFTLRLLGFLYNNKVAVHTLISNHGNEFVTGYENLINRNLFQEAGYIIEQQKPSFAGLRILLSESVVTESEVTSLINKAYKPSLKVLDYTLNDEGITLFTHAPVRFDSIQDITHQLGVTYDDSSKEALAKTIDQINEQFTQIVSENRVHQYCSVNHPMDLANMTPEERKSYPLIYMMWNRWNESKETEDARPASVNDYKINYVHGHDPFQSRLDHINNMDTPNGKGSRRDLESTKRHVKNMPESREKAELQETLNHINHYKVLDSSDKGLRQNQNHEFIPTEITDEPVIIRTDRRTDKISAISSGIGLLVGVALATADLAPISWALIGAAAVGGVIGFGIAKILPSNETSLNEQEEVEYNDGNEFSALNTENSSAIVLKTLGGSVEKTSSVDGQESVAIPSHESLFSNQANTTEHTEPSEEAQRATINRQ